MYLRVIECFTFIDTIFISSHTILKLDFITSVKWVGISVFICPYYFRKLKSS